MAMKASTERQMEDCEAPRVPESLSQVACVALNERATMEDSGA